MEVSWLSFMITPDRRTPSTSSEEIKVKFVVDKVEMPFFYNTER